MVIGFQVSIILSIQQLMAGGKSDGIETQIVYQSDVIEQYQWFTDVLLSLASNLLPPLPGIMITGLNPCTNCNKNRRNNIIIRTT